MYYCINAQLIVIQTADKLLTNLYVGKNLNIGRLLCSKKVTVYVHIPDHPPICGHPAQWDFQFSAPHNQVSDIKS
jgi:hypothetical protein